MTVGSPLARPFVHSHLRRLEERFPYERVGPWLNVVGRFDPVSAGRGIGGRFLEALDTFVATGAGLVKPHVASRYLSQDVVADAIDLVLRRAPEPSIERLPELRVSDDLLPVVARAQFALRLEQAMDEGDKRMRFGRARQARAADIALEAVQASGEYHPILERLDHNNAAVLRGRFDVTHGLATLLTVAMENAVAPYEVAYTDKDETGPLKALAHDLGFPSKTAQIVIDAEADARKLLSADKAWQRKALFAAGALALASAPWMVLAMAPAGVVGGAGIVAGLAALGPGGMLGGLGVVGIVGGAGGAAIAGALVTGSAAAVEERAVFLLALALAEKRSEASAGRAAIWKMLVEMESTLSGELARLARFSDPKAPGVKDLNDKRTPVRKALEALEKEGLAQYRLGGGHDRDY